MHTHPRSTKSKQWINDYVAKTDARATLAVKNKLDAAVLNKDAAKDKWKQWLDDYAAETETMLDAAALDKATERLEATTSLDRATASDEATAKDIPMHAQNDLTFNLSTTLFSAFSVSNTN